jgi:hypothetical protein
LEEPENPLAVRHGDLATGGDENGRPHRRPERGEGYFQIRLMKDPSTGSERSFDKLRMSEAHGECRA